MPPFKWYVATYCTYLVAAQGWHDCGAKWSGMQTVEPFAANQGAATVQAALPALKLENTSNLHR